MRWWGWLLLLVLGPVLALAIYIAYGLHSLQVERISDDLHVLFGMGGNVAVLNTNEDTVVVDSMTFHYQGGRIAAVAEELTGKPVVAVINTHYHLDHTHGNPAFEDGTRVIATERTLHHLKVTDSEYFSGEAASLLPNETFDDRLRLDFGNKHVTVLFAGRGHTDGDLVALFEEERVAHLGDLLFNGHYPNIDLEAGGSIREWPDTLDKAMSLDFDRVIPGHGPVTDREGVRQFQRFMIQLMKVGEDAVANGLTKEQTQASTALTEDAEYEEIRMVIPIGLNREFVLGRAYDEASGSVVLH